MAATVAALFAAASGGFSLVAWLLGRWDVVTLGKDYIPMAPITALLFLILGACQGLRLLFPRERWAGIAAQCAAALTLGIIAGELLRRFAGWGPPWDAWFGATQVLVGATPAGRMAEATVLGFACVAGALLARERPGRAARGASAALTAPALVIGIGHAIGYAIGAPLDYGGIRVPMALPTALAFTSLAASMFAAGPHRRGELAASPANYRFHLVRAILVALGLIGFLGYHAIHREMKAAREAAWRELDAVADLEAGQVQLWLRERLDDGNFIQAAPSLRASLAAIAESGPSEQTLARLRASLAAPTRRFARVTALDREGQPLLVLPEEAPAEPLPRELLERARQDTRPWVAGVLRQGGEDRHHFLMVVPITAPEHSAGPPVGFVAILGDAHLYLFGVVGRWPLPSATAETVLLQREGDMVVNASPLRHGPRPPFAQRFAVNHPDRPGTAAMRGETSVREGIDYRGVPVLTAARPIEGMPWVLMAKIDRAEAYASLRKGLATNLVLAGSFIAVVALAGTVIWRGRHAATLSRMLAAERATAAARARLALVMQHARDLILILDEQGHILEANEAALVAYGYTLPELRSLPPGHLVATRGAPDQQVRPILQGGGLHEAVHRRKDGREFPVEGTEQVVTIEDRRMVLAIYRDAGDAALARLRLRESEEKFRAYVEHAADAIFVHDENGRFLEVNDRACASLGYTREELLALTFDQVETQVEIERAREFWTSTRPGESRTVLGIHRRRDGSTFPVEVRFVTFVLHGERRLLSLARDISERQAQERALRRITRLYAALSQIGACIARAPDRDGVLRGVCATLVEQGGFCLAWVGHPDPATGDLAPLAVHGDETGYCGHLRLRTDLPDDQLGVTGRALRYGRTEICNDYFSDDRTLPWRDAATAAGVRSCASLPLRQGGQAVAVLSVYARETGIFGTEEMALLEEAARSVGHALDNLELQRRRAEAEAARQENEERLRHLGDSLPDSYVFQCTHDRDGNPVFRYVSSGVERVHGLRAAEVLRDGRLLHQTIHAEDLACYRAATASGASTPGDLRVEMRHRHPDGSWRWLELRARPRRLPDGAVEWNGVATDITTRKHAEQASRETQQRLHLASEAARVGFWELELESGRMRWSEQFALMNGLGPGVSSGMIDDLLPLLDEESRLRMLKARQRTMETGADWNLEIRVRRPDGSERWALVRGHLQRGSAGLPDRVFGVDIEITDRKAAEERTARQFEELSRWREATLGREDRILELKREVNELLHRAGLPARYSAPEVKPPA